MKIERVVPPEDAYISPQLVTRAVARVTAGLSAEQRAELTAFATRLTRNRENARMLVEGGIEAFCVARLMDEPMFGASTDALMVNDGVMRALKKSIGDENNRLRKEADNSRFA